MTFKNDTADLMEICVPVAVQLSIRFYIEPGEELTAKAINDAVGQLAWAASDDVFRHPRIDGDWSMNVLGVEPGAVADFYNHEKEGETPLPDGVEYADPDPVRNESQLAALIREIETDCRNALQREKALATMILEKIEAAAAKGAAAAADPVRDAAPDMLAALKALEMWHRGYGTKSRREVFEEYVRPAIAKAEGRA